MTYSLNTTNPNYSNSISYAAGSFGAKDARSGICAPASLPKYSYIKKMEEKDNFRKNINNEIYQKQNKKNSLLPKIAFVSAITAGFFLLKKKLGK